MVPEVELDIMKMVTRRNFIMQKALKSIWRVEHILMKKVFTEVSEEALLAMKNSAEAAAVIQVMKISNTNKIFLVMVLKKFKVIISYDIILIAVLLYFWINS